MLIVYPDWSWIEGERNRKTTGWFFNHETKGTHHFVVIDGSEIIKEFIGKEVAVPINQVKFFVIGHK
jgi:hypothetical protein